MTFAPPSDINRSALRGLGLVFLLVWVPSTIAAQARFKSGVDLVALDVCVRNRAGSPTTGLDLKDFLVLDNNVPQSIAFFSADGRVPLAVSLLIDNSHSMSGLRLERARAAAVALIGILRSDDLVEIMSFNDHANLRYPMGADHAQAKLALDDISAVGRTNLYEAVLVALRNQERARRHRVKEHREVIIVLSDGENTTGPLTFGDVLEDVRRSGAIVYTISLRTDDHDHVVAPRWEMTQLAFDTGGRAIAVRDLGSLTQVYRDIGSELVHLYRLGYIPSGLTRDGRWRRISVRIPTKDLVIRTRSGYYAPRPFSLKAGGAHDGLPLTPGSIR